MFQIVGGHAVDHLLQRIGQERAALMVVDHRRIFLEQVALERFGGVGFQRQRTLAARHHEQLVLQLHEVEVILLLGDGVLHRPLDDVADTTAHLARRGCEHRADGSAHDDDVFRLLKQNAWMAAGHEEAADDGTDDDE